MDTVWMAYIRDQRHNLYRIDPKKYSDYEKTPDQEFTIGVYDSQDKAERALGIVMQRMGWRGKSYHPNVWVPPDQYEYGWKALPFNQFNSQDLYSISHLFWGR